MTLTRRSFIKSAAAAGALALTRPWGALADTLGPAGSVSTSRSSRLFPGVRLVHADLHNHTLMSDGDGNPEAAFGSMRSAGLDVAALTDHSTIQWGSPVDPCFWGCGGEESLAGIDEAKWARTAELADLANADGSFIAIRGFEWSSPFQGHMNVWFSERWIDPLHTAGVSTGEGYLPYANEFAHEEGLPPMSPAVIKAYDAALKALPTSGTTMLPFYQWLKSAPDTAVIGGGEDGLASFNHPGREPGRFGYFRHQKKLPGIVAMEIFNRKDDYLFQGTEYGQQSPLNECLNAGWKVGLSGVTDEHGTKWGHEPGKGRTGLWVSQWSRAGVRQALQARRFFATREAGLRIDASAKRRPMGSYLQHTSGNVQFKLDIDRGPDWYGKVLNVQVLRPGNSMPTVVTNRVVTVPSDTGPVITFSVPLDIADGKWVVLRVTDPSLPADDRARPFWRSFGRAVAYSSPWFLVP